MMEKNGLDCCSCRMRNVIMGIIIKSKVYCWNCAKKLPKKDKMNYSHGNIYSKKCKEVK